MPQRILDHLVELTAAQHRVGDVGGEAVEEETFELAVAVELGDGAQGVAVEEALDEDAVDFLADATAPSIVQVLDHQAIRQLDAAQVAQMVVVVGDGLAVLRLGQALTALVVGGGDGALPQQTILGVLVASSAR